MTRLVLCSAILILFISGTSFTKISSSSYNYKSHNLIDGEHSINTLGDCDLVVNAGFDVLVCEGSPVPLSGEVSSTFSSLLWTSSSGLGSFDDAEILNPIFTPAAEDAGNTITLTLTVFDEDSNCEAFDELELTIFSLPLVNAGDDIVVCEGSTFQLNGFVDQEDYVIEWEGGTGLFSNIFSSETTYQPTILDPNPLVLTLTARDPIGTCERVRSDITITFTPAPAVLAGSDAFTCGTEAFDLSGLSEVPNSENATLLNWSTDGSGSFSDPTILMPQYIPSAEDLNTTVVLTLEGTGDVGCGNVTDEIMLTVYGDVAVDAGSDEVITSEDQFSFANAISPASIENYVSLLWEHDGSGEISNPEILYPVYTPSLMDEGKNITLSLTAVGHCETIVDEMILTVETVVTGLVPDLSNAITLGFNAEKRSLRVESTSFSDWAVFDLNGRTISQGETQNVKDFLELSMAQVNEGVYIFRMGDYSEKFIIHK